MAAKKRSISYVQGELGSGRNRAGRPIQIRTNGFQNDVAYLTRLRCALFMDGKLPRDEKAQVLAQIDRLMESLAKLSEQRAEPKVETKSA